MSEANTASLSRTSDNTSSTNEDDENLLIRKKRLNISKKTRQKNRNEKVDFEHSINKEEYHIHETNRIDVIDVEQNCTVINEASDRNTDVNLNHTGVTEGSDHIRCGCFGKMFQYLKRNLFRSGSSSPTSKRAKLNNERSESDATSSTSHLSNQIERKSNHHDENLSGSVVQEIVHLESEPLSINHEGHSSLQPIENEEVSGSNQNDEFQQTQQAQKRKRNKRRKKSPVGLENRLEMPEIIRNDPVLKRYWKNRYRLFSKYDEGIRLLDAESWFSVTPEKVGAEIARRCQCDVIVDAFCGAGGNAIQFAFTCERVIAIDIDVEKIKSARHNASIYGVADRIEFIVGDFFQIAPFLKADVVFLSPPWGGPSYTNFPEYSLSQIMERYGGQYVYNMTKQISDHIAYFLPRNINVSEVASLEPDDYVQIDRNYLGKEFVAITAYFGDLVEDYGNEWNN